MYRVNFFGIISEGDGNSVFSKSSGSVGFKQMTKRSLVAFNSLLTAIVQKLVSLPNCKNILLVLTGVKKDAFRELFKNFIAKINKLNIKLRCIDFDDKVAHNGCRKKLLA
jgi:ribosomal protein S11